VHWEPLSPLQDIDWHRAAQLLAHCGPVEPLMRGPAGNAETLPASTKKMAAAKRIYRPFSFHEERLSAIWSDAPEPLPPRRVPKKQYRT
jgi:hypothetical protein